MRSKKQQDELERVFWALSHAARRKILYFISQNDDSSAVGPIVDQMDIGWSGTNKHLKELVAAGFLSVERAGNHQIYKLNREPFRVVTGWIKSI